MNTKTQIVSNNSECNIITVDAIRFTSEPIFAVKDGLVHGMVVKDDKGYILRINRSAGSCGYHDSLSSLIQECELHFGYKFYLNIPA